MKLSRKKWKWRITRSGKRKEICAGFWALKPEGRRSVRNLGVGALFWYQWNILAWIGFLLSLNIARRTPSHCSTTQHDMLPQHLVCKYELNCEYCNTTLARNKALWWWSDKIEICRSVLKCFKWVYMKLYVHSLVDKLKWWYTKCVLRLNT